MDWPWGSRMLARMTRLATEGDATGKWLIVGAWSACKRLWGWLGRYIAGSWWTAGNGIFEDSSGILNWRGSCCLTPRSWISDFPVKLPSLSRTRQKTDRKLMIFPRKSLLWHRNWGWKVNVFTQLWAFLTAFTCPGKGVFCVFYEGNWEFLMEEYEENRLLGRRKGGIFERKTGDSC